MLSVKRFFLSFFAVLGLLLTAPAPVLAHDDVSSTNPVAGSSVPAPEVITLRFNAVVDPALVNLTLTNADGMSVTPGRATVDGQGGVVFSVPERLSPGLWTAVWRTVSTDSHPAAGSFAFTVVDEGQPLTTVTVPNTAPTSGSDSQTNLPLYALLTVLVVAGAGAGFLAARHR